MAIFQMNGVQMAEGEIGGVRPVDERRARRLALAMPARCRTLSGFAEDVVIRDVSEGGCRIAGAVLKMCAGDRLLLRPPGMESLAALVRWANRHEAGVEFERPLYGPVVEHLQRQYLTFLPTEVPYRAAGGRLAA